MRSIQLETFKKISMLSQVVFAPDGRQAAFLRHQVGENNYHSDLYLYDIATERMRRLTSAGDINSFVFENASTLLFTAVRAKEDEDMVQRGDPQTSVYRLPLHGGEAQHAFSVPQHVHLIGRLSDTVFVLKGRVDLEKADRLFGKQGHERTEALAMIEDERSRFAIYDEYPFWLNGAGVINKTRVGLFLYDLETGQLTQITERLQDVQGVTVSEALGRIAWHGCHYDTIQDYRTGVYLYDHVAGSTDCYVQEGVWRVRQVAPWTEGVLLAGSDMKAYNYSETPAVYCVTSPGATPVLLHPERLTIGNSIISDIRYGGSTSFKVQGDTVALINSVDDSSRLISIDKNGKLTELVSVVGSIDGFDISGDTVLYIGMADMAPQALFCFKDQENQKVSNFNDDFVAQHEIIQPQRLFFTNRDGVDIHGFVLCPPGYQQGDNKSYPGVLNIHGGPRLSYGEVFIHEMQVEAHKGYFVFFCNPRGSDGRGDEFAHIRGRYGTIDFQDVMEFTDRVLAIYPELDQKRLGVSGGSYGGFLTNWIIGNTDRFAAAVSQRGISSFVSMEGTSDCGRAFNEGHIGGLVADGLQRLLDQSPITHADKVKTPTLFIHAEEDYRCWKIESLQMFNAIRANGVEARMCLFRGENHELSRSGKPTNRVKRLQEIMGFLDRHLLLEVNGS